MVIINLYRQTCCLTLLKLTSKSIPEEIFGYSKNKRGSCEVLIKWQGLPPHEATWEDYDKLQYSLEAKRKALNITQAGKIILRTEYILY